MCEISIYPRALEIILLRRSCMNPKVSKEHFKKSNILVRTLLHRPQLGPLSVPVQHRSGISPSDVTEVVLHPAR